MFRKAKIIPLVVKIFVKLLTYFDVRFGNFLNFKKINNQTQICVNWGLCLNSQEYDKIQNDCKKLFVFYSISTKTIIGEIVFPAIIHKVLRENTEHDCFIWSKSKYGNVCVMHPKMMRQVVKLMLPRPFDSQW